MKYSVIGVTALATCLAGCGGSGGLASIPAPAPAPASPPSPSPTPTPPEPAFEATFLDAQATAQEFAAFTTGDRLRIRYDPQNRRYQVMAPGKDWEAVYGHASFGPGNYHIPGPMEDVGLVSARTRPDHPDPALRFHYSSLATWARQLPETGTDNYLSGVIAFGSPTPTDGVPLTGSASYLGPIEGSASFPVYSSNGFAYWDRAPIEGSVSLQFDFSNGSLAGEIRPRLACDCGPISVPTLNFSDTAFAVGSQSYSGRFLTEVGGANAFSGIFTGPGAEELIGQWAFPFLLDGTAHSAEGVWVAKRGD